jgi:hypothetical protein
MVAAEAELDWVSQRGAANDLDLRAVAESHFQQPAAKVVIAINGNHAAFAADAQLVQMAGIGSSAVIAGVVTAGLLHNCRSGYPYERSGELDVSQLRMSFKSDFVWFYIFILSAICNVLSTNIL